MTWEIVILVETYKDQCIKLLQVIPDADGPQIEAIAQQVGCSERTAYRAKADVQASIAMSNRKIAKKKVSKKKKASKKRRTKSKKKKGKRGPKKKSPSNIQVHKVFQKKQQIQIPRIPPDMTFEHFCKTHAFPYYKGLYRWQYQWHNDVWPWKYSLTLAPRDHGKSIGHGDLCEWAMSAKGWDILYLGWTNRRREIAQFVNNFFLIRRELVSDKASSPYHFKTIYDTRFDTYSVKSKEILGKHEIGNLDREITDENRYLEDFVRNEERPLLMIIDDAIDNTFRKERHKEKDLEDFFLSTILSINPDKLMTVGTHKFEGDFYHFIQEVFGDDLLLYKRATHITKEDPRFNQEPDNPTNLLCPERWIDGPHPDYPHYLELQEKKKQGFDITTLIEKDQQLLQRKDLRKKRKQVGEYWWFSDYEQNPHPITGEVWDDLCYETVFEGTAFYDLITIAIDRATTTKIKSDYTGIVITFREKKIYERINADGDIVQYQKYLVTHDYTRKIRITDLLQFIELLYKRLRKKYRYYIKIIIPVETQGGGHDFIALSQDSGATFAGLIIPVHSTRDKLERIEDNLGTPIKEGDIKFLDQLETSELITEIGTFPYCSKIDALDALSMGYFESEKMPRSHVDVDHLTNQLKQYRDQDGPKKPFQQFLQPQTRRTIF